MELELLRLCEKCDLKKTRTNVVLPRGNDKALVMFIGEAPGRNEDERGIPFVGTAGAWFESATMYLGLTKDQYYVTNTVKCRPVTFDDKNRTPTELEIGTCGCWLKDEIESIRPKVIVLMGATALKAFFKETKLSNVAGEELAGHILSKNYGIKIFVLYHPAVLIYDNNYYYPIYKRHLDNLKMLLVKEGIISEY